MRSRAPALASGPIALAIIAAWFLYSAPAPQGEPFVIAGNSIRVTLATTSQERAQGLSGTAPLSPDTGMLFVFPREGTYSFWMKDMQYSLDILWIDGSGAVVYSRESVSPDTYPAAFSSQDPARFVLELPAGYAQEHGVGVGAQLEWSGGSLEALEAQ